MTLQHIELQPNAAQMPFQMNLHALQPAMEIGRDNGLEELTTGGNKQFAAVQQFANSIALNRDGARLAPFNLCGPLGVCGVAFFHRLEDLLGCGQRANEPLWNPVIAFLFLPAPVARPSSEHLRFWHTRKCAASLNWMIGRHASTVASNPPK